MCKISWWKRVFWAGLGAVLSSLSTPQIERLANAGYDRWCGGRTLLIHGKNTLRTAIKDGRKELLPTAKSAFEKSASCHVPEAFFLLGIMYCNGMGVELDRARGMQLIRNAAASEPQWSMQILASPELCPRSHDGNTAWPDKSH